MQASCTTSREKEATASDPCPACQAASAPHAEDGVQEQGTASYLPPLVRVLHPQHKPQTCSSHVTGVPAVFGAAVPHVSWHTPHRTWHTRTALPDLRQDRGLQARRAHHQTLGLQAPLAEQRVAHTKRCHTSCGPPAACPCAGGAGRRHAPASASSWSPHWLHTHTAADASSRSGGMAHQWINAQSVQTADTRVQNVHITAHVNQRITKLAHVSAAQQP